MVLSHRRGDFTPAFNVFRVRLVEACERAGISAEAISSAIEDGQLSLAFLDRPQYRWAAFQTETYGELAERLGLAFDVMRDVGAALGPRPPSAHDRVREGDEGIFRLIGLMASMVDTDALARIGRVYVDGLRRMAEAEAVLFDTYLVGGFVRMGMSYGQALERSSALGTETFALLEQMILALIGVNGSAAGLMAWSRGSSASSTRWDGIRDRSDHRRSRSSTSPGTHR